MPVTDFEKPVLLTLFLLAGIAAVALLGAAGPGSLGAAPAQAQVLPPPEPLVAPGIAVFFTDPTSETFGDGPETALLEAIDAARARVDVAAYDLDLWGMREALIAAHRRGVTVRMVVEADSLDRPEIKAGTLARASP